MTLQYCFDGSAKKVNNPSVSSPRTWGCFSCRPASTLAESVFPTHVGVFPSWDTFLLCSDSLPHARGGVSTYASRRASPSWSSPRTWGCFYGSEDLRRDYRVFPTHVGVFPQNSAMPKPLGCLPHARGGVSDSSLYVLITHSSSPRTWGCFCLPSTNLSLFAVFPTHVGVFLSSS